MRVPRLPFRRSSAAGVAIQATIAIMPIASMSGCEPPPPASASSSDSSGSSDSRTQRASEADSSSPSSERAAASTPAPARPSHWPKKHIVEYGDTYYRIALRYYDDGSKAFLIEEANPDMPATALLVGQPVIIPDPAETD